MASKSVMQANTKLPIGFLSSHFLMHAILIMYVEVYYSLINLADFNIPTKYEKLKSIIEISRIMLQIKVSGIISRVFKVWLYIYLRCFLQKLLFTTITWFKLMKQRAKKEKFASGRVIMPVIQREHRSPQKPKVSNKLRFIEALYLTPLTSLT